RSAAKCGIVDQESANAPRTNANSDFRTAAVRNAHLACRPSANAPQTAPSPAPGATDGPGSPLPAPRPPAPPRQPAPAAPAPPRRGATPLVGRRPAARATT